METIDLFMISEADNLSKGIPENHKQLYLDMVRTCLEYFEMTGENGVINSMTIQIMKEVFIKLGYEPFSVKRFIQDLKLLYSTNKEIGVRTDEEALVDMMTIKTKDMLRYDFYFSVYNILIEYGKANSRDKAQFIRDHMDTEINEWRFCGNLGFGGKYWKKRNVVTCYPEDETPLRNSIKETINYHLSRVKKF